MLQAHSWDGLGVWGHAGEQHSQGWNEAGREKQPSCTGRLAAREDRDTANSAGGFTGATASPGQLRGAPSPLFQQAARSQDCSGTNHAIFCFSPARNNLFLTQLGCSCVCRLLLWCGGWGWRTAVSPTARQGSPAWGEGPCPDPATSYGAVGRSERWRGTSTSPCNGARSHLFPWLPPSIPPVSSMPVPGYGTQPLCLCSHSLIAGYAQLGAIFGTSCGQDADPWACQLWEGSPAQSDGQKRARTACVCWWEQRISQAGRGLGSSSPPALLVGLQVRPAGRAN